MGELAEDFNFYREKKREEKDRIEPSRTQYAVNLLTEHGYAVAWNQAERAIYIYRPDDRKKHICKLYPYTGWWSGKGIGSGRGIHQLIKKLRKEN